MSKFRLHKFVLAIIFVALVALPLVVQRNLYFVGGDDMRLYYIFPEKYLDNLAFNIISDNTLGGANTGYYPTSQMVPMLYFILILKKVFPFFNTQNLMAGLNYAFGFLFFYLFLTIWIRNKNNFYFFSKIAASFFYIFSPLLDGTLYKNQLMAIYLVSLMPVVLYFFIKAVKEKRYVYSLVAAFVVSIFSTTLNTYPWSIPIIIASFPLIYFIFVKDKKTFLVNSTIFLFAFLVLNMHWIFHFVNSNINVTGISGSLSYYSTDEFKKENIRGIVGVSTLLNPLVPLLLRVDYNFRQNFKPVDLINLIFIATITLAGVKMKKLKNRRFINLFFVGVFGFLLSWFLFSPNLGNWGPKVFLKFATTLPFGTMFRNMWDKFALPFSFYYAVLLAVSLVVIYIKTKTKKFSYMILLVVLVVLVTNMRNFLRPRILNGANVGSITGEFNDDYSNLVGYLKGLDDASRVLWIPMTSANYVNIEDKYLSGHFYSGLSPLRELAGKSDYAGRFAFMLPSDVFHGDRLIDMLKEGKYTEFVENMQKMNVKYIVLDKQNIPEGMKDYLYDVDRKYLRFQNKGLQDVLLGKKLKDFGTRYSLYLINDSYISDRIYLTDLYEEFPNDFSNVEYEKVNSYLYNIHIGDLKGPKKLVFLDPYYKQWVLYLTNDGRKIPFEKGENTIVNGWANGWEIDSDKLSTVYSDSFDNKNGSGGLDLDLELYFEPQKYNRILYPFTVFAYSVTLLTVFTYLGYELYGKMIHE